MPRKRIETVEHQKRVVIEGVRPEIDCGRFPIKRTIGETVLVEADVFADGHDVLSCVLLHRPERKRAWTEVPMEPVGNDRWRGSFQVRELGRHYYTIAAWIDRFGSWRRDLEKRALAGQDVSVHLLEGATLVRKAASRARGRDRARLQHWAEALQETARRVPVPEAAVEEPAQPVPAGAPALALDPRLAALLARYAEREPVTTYGKELAVLVDREKAGFSTWYEMFPRSCAAEPGRHGTFRDAEARLAYVAAMGFDVLYLPPIHPIGHTNRKGRNNALVVTPGDPGTPWAIGSEAGGHKTVHPELGTLEDFRRFVRKAKEHGLEVALDLAFQCSPDHPWVREHPEWFRRLPDGSVRHAENPPKKYEDIFPLHFETETWRELWEELKSVILFWIEQGVRIFRVDNPHTKPFAFWEWVLDEVRREHPDVIFLSEAFTRPRVMYRLAKLGFAQSYTYFAWRNTKWELTQYLTELTGTDVAEYFRPNFWPNTPDILTTYLQTGGRPAFMARLVLAATLAANYGIYGPAFELCEARPREPRSEEYLDSEKYEIRSWDLEQPHSLRDFIARVNHIRRENPALHTNRTLRFHPVSNDELIVYSKHAPDRSNVMLMAVNLDPYHTHAGWVDLDLHTLGLAPDETYQVHDLLSGAHYIWHGAHNYVELDPHVVPAHIFRIERKVRTEMDFEYYL